MAGCAGPRTDGPSTVSFDPGEVARLADRQAQFVAKAPFLKADSVPQDWAALLGDPALGELLAQAQAQNLDLQMAASRVAQSAAALGVTQALGQPHTELGGSVTRSAISANSPLANLGAYTGGFNLWDVGAQVSWEVDFWGHVASLTEAARARWQASALHVAAARLSVSAEVARQLLLLREVQQQVRIQSELAAVAARRVQLMESRQRHGMATAAELTTAQADALAAEVPLAGLRQQAQSLRNGLSLLLGQVPHALDARLDDVTDVAPPASLPVGVPSELARQRPDVLEAEADLRAAVADVSAARSDFYPRITLGASLGLEAFKLRDLGSWDSRQYSVGPAFYLPLFEGGRLRQTLVLREARQQEAALAYRRTVLKAWQEVDDALTQQAEARRQWQLWEAAVQQRWQALQAVERARRAGAADDLAVAEARRGWLVASASRVGAATQVKLGAVALMRALGGGWTPPGSDSGAGS
ncbi:efflux transporter outer membrane subunit [Aquabacterium sp.]|uniref:efflux transporter outer membrane subunit n=1 Tax=Aquabacterium sp. TaxID=1872578 RepID=UPI0025B8CDC5|nr:efflux transporter outer membrane subunit [Aquabacterium sp.]